ncbi:MAG TPA: membrane protein insertase YidC [Actinocrinis sp.]|jgi:YidC/Oxa1 family membrane protein insertase|uniref:YidC/Oxa1 family membrane protein insertase n=1 Tax=Actinocrinis sp. TaxID=1920516 RepID=UPI002DDD86D8|nr:membrane protein insertase YidC [Actinocrinis sp.]HEV3170918.1 membrane protein insertase YidC [Actinocrinis sp.]
MSPFALLNPAVNAAYHAVYGMAAALAPVVGDGGFAVAIVLFTLAVRLLLHPLARTQARAAARARSARAALAPELAKLRRRHRNDQAQLNRATVELYRKHGISPFAGFLPLLAQLPVFALMYRLFSTRTIGGRANLLLGHGIAGVPLGSSLRGVLAAGAFTHLAVFAVLLLAVGAVARWSSEQTRALTASAAAAGEPNPLGPVARWLPYGTVLSVAFIPLAAGLYIATTTLWTVAERALLARGLA